MQNAKGNDRTNLSGEYVRVYNVGRRPVELAGFVVKDVALHKYTFLAETLEPGYTALLLSGAGRQQRRGGQLVFHWKAGSPIWNNDADTASLFDPDGRRIDTFRMQKRRRGRSRQVWLVDALRTSKIGCRPPLLSKERLYL